MRYLLLFSLTAASAADFAGSASCRSCHPSQFHSQTGTAHARALARSTPAQPGEWAFGAGTQAFTFVRRLNRDFYLEESQTWYRALGGYARTPGHSTAAGVRDRIFDPSASILRCFACHSTGPLQVSTEEGILPYELGVRCEACHGPAAAHVLEPARVRPVNPALSSADEINRQCGECHRMPAKERNESSLRNPWNVRHQPLMLAASRCYLKSSGRLTCFTCHSPHEPLEKNHRAYSPKCVACHSAPAHKSSITGRACVDCHMPAVQPQPYLTFANHRIGIYSRSEPLIPRR